MTNQGLLSPNTDDYHFSFSLAVMGESAVGKSRLIQCTLPAPEENTVYVQPGGALDCSEGAVIGEGESCTVACNVGYSQGAAGTYVYTCGAGGALTPPAPQCAACPTTGSRGSPTS